MCSLHLKIIEFLFLQTKKHLKFCNKSLPQGEKPALLEGTALIFHFFSYMIPICTVSSIEPDSCVMIGSAVRLKNTLRGHWFGFCSLCSLVENGMIAWLFFWVDWMFCLLSLSQPLMIHVLLHGSLYSH